MAASDFGTAIYTHCAPEQGLDGVAGMQFQSRSPGIDREILTVIRRHLIYEPPERLIQEQQPVSAFPPSFAHVYDRVYATAAGVYIGLESGGARQGNHLTHAIATDDDRAYRSLRPAQLFGAPFWRTEPEPSTHSARLPASWRPGPLDAAKASEFVRGQPHGVALLSAILSALLAHADAGRAAEARRVLLIAEDAELVLLWLTAATLLIPQQQALRVGFKVFTADPARSTLPVVAVNPAWVRSAATVQNDRGYAVFDLIQHRWTPVPDAAGARHWARLFCETDPGGVIEAVEMAGASGISGQAAHDLALAAVLGQKPDAARAGSLIRWLRTGPAALREVYGGTIVAALTAVPDSDLQQLREIDRIVHEQFPGRSDQVRLSLLRLELTQAVADPMRMQPREPRRDVSADIEPDAVRLVAESLRAARGPAFDAVLCVSSRFGIAVPLDAVREATNAFVAYWAEHPDAAYDPSAWPPTPPAYSMLRDELAARLLNRADAVGDWWNKLSGWAPERPDLTLPLDRELLSAAMERADAGRRLLIVRHVLEQRQDTGGPYREKAEILWRRTAPTVDELSMLCRSVPAGTAFDPALFAGVVVRAASPAGLRELELCDQLDRHRLLRLDQATAELLACHRWLVDFERQPNVPASAEVDHLRRLPRHLLLAHAGRLAQALQAADDPRRIVGVLAELPVEVGVQYLHVVSHHVPLTAARFAAIWAVYARVHQHIRHDLWYSELNATMIGWCLEASRRKRRKVTGLLRTIDARLAGDWERWRDEVRRDRRWWRRLLSRFLW